VFTGTYPIGTAFHSFKKAQFQLQDPDPDWRFESGSTWIRIRNNECRTLIFGHTGKI